MPWSEVYARAESFADLKLYDALTCATHDHWAIGNFAERVCTRVGEQVAEELGGEYWDLEVLDLPKIYLPCGDEVDGTILKEVVKRHADTAIAACSTEDEITDLGCESCASFAEWEERLEYWSSAR